MPEPTTVMTTAPGTTATAAPTTPPATTTTTTESAPAGQTTTPAKPSGVPERYELKMPEKSVLDQRAVDETATIARELGLSNEAAQKLLERRNTDVSQALEVSRQTTETGWREQVDKWANSARADKEYGGEKYDANIAIALDAMNKLATPELKALLADPNLGFGNHPEVVRLFYRIGTKLQPGSFVPGGVAPQAKDVPIHQKLYPPKTGT